MDYDRPHRSSTNNTSNASSELFICFTSRLSSSSSMKLPSKSILSPARTDKQISLSSSLSRRLRSSNGSIKGGQSPMFMKKRGCALENTEPSSPKVTCIGQVRVKTKKKQQLKMRSRSKRRGGGGSAGEASFRKIEQQVVQQQSTTADVYLQNNQPQQQGGEDCLRHKNTQKWVHLPLSICETLRAFGSEFNCFLPCRPPCMSAPAAEERVKDKMGVAESTQSSSTRSCGAVFARWLVALHDGEEKGRQIELVVGGEEEEEAERTEQRRSLHRRHVMEDIDMNVIEKFDGEKKNGVVEEEEEGRVSICIPPKNALLLMRCRSDPLRMAALANRFWESPVVDEEEEENDDDKDGKDEHRHDTELGGGEDNKEIRAEVMEAVLKTEQKEEEFGELGLVNEEDEVFEEDENSAMEKEEDKQECAQESSEEINENDVEKHEEEEEEGVLVRVDMKEGEEMASDSSPEALVDSENKVSIENEDELLQEEEEKDDEIEEGTETQESSASIESVQSENGEQEEEIQEIETETEKSSEGEEQKSTIVKETTDRPLEDEETVTHQRCEQENQENSAEEAEEEEEERENQCKIVERESSILPDCLLLMMCEPKLSMEVSKETWVCSTDFIRCLPTKDHHQTQPQVKKTDGGDEPKKRVSTDSNPAQPTHNYHLQPPRSSCSFPAPSAAAAGVSMASMIEQKLVKNGGGAYEPFVLTRCKSEPMRSSAKFAPPEACFWKNRKLEPHHRGAPLGVGAAGIGF